MRSMSCFCRKRETTSGPKVKETPRSFSLHPVMSLSGSDHSKSHNRPQSGIYKSQRITTQAKLGLFEDHALLQKIRAPLTSVGRITRRICSMEFRSGLRPPCIVKIFSSMIAAIGRQLKQSVNVFHSLILYLLLHSS